VRITLVAPGVGPPWTEGRKNLVRDLVNAWSDEHELTVITTPLAGVTESVGWTLQHDLSHPAIQLLRLVADLPELLNRANPEAVIHFPYGSFRATRGVGNLWSIRRIAHLCDQLGIAHVTLLYSMDRLVPPRVMAACSRSLVAGSSTQWKGRQVELGIDTSGWPGPNLFAGGRRLLFLAGSTGRHRRDLSYVLETRGLGVVLRAGAELSRLGADLTLASPMFEQHKFLQRIRTHRHNTWDNAHVSFDGKVVVPDVFTNFDYLLFPYKSDIPVFRPTSVMEAMFMGVIPVLSDLPFLRHTVDQATAAVWLDPDDGSSLARALARAFAEPSTSAATAEAASDYAQRNFTIAVTARQILESLSSAR